MTIKNKKNKNKTSETGGGTIIYFLPANPNNFTKLF